ncbi:hypothetical protein HG535_0A01590 [Zygotorulaspora mrakii]|uniref:Bud site selection protein 5 n=1 Tax=Zygotorulaspora mrakii TaxID=42260 RepID=A0A7H9AVJ9_ZYGMR|nr:uncharacterized protein HG535_0A01590 [Zygotorulaspora mrakii]QLG70221.1 hypothetical protein HG535_0A01590 [Zygotorulaspora mrakii]
MDKHPNATPHLPVHYEDNFISPTKPLEMSSELVDRQYIDTEFEFEETDQRQMIKNVGGHLGASRSLSDDSFITAQSVDATALFPHDDLMNAKPVATWTDEDSGQDLTPTLNVEAIQTEELITPKADEFNTTFGTIDTADAGIDFSESTARETETEPESGLGIATRISRIQINPIATSREMIASERKSSPAKAIRTSMILNGQKTQDATETDKWNNDNLHNRELYNVSYNDPSFIKSSTSLKRTNTVKKSSEMNLDDENYACLFIIAVHSFSANSLDNADDISICLSFEKNDIAFVHTVDESGWGEVTLLKNVKRGWVPFNYFSDTVKSINEQTKTYDLQEKTETRLPLRKLLSASAKFLLHPHDTMLPDNSGKTFNIDYINGVRDGVKVILEMTECVSRSNDLVQSKPNIRKARKTLLANWYNLMIKADYYKHSVKEEHIETLIKLLFAVLNQAFIFFDTWSTEKASFDEENRKGKNHSPVEEKTNLAAVEKGPSQNLIYLEEPPTAMNRLHEIYDLLFCYSGLILGRLDMIEHNPSGCEVLETIVHQVIVLLRDLLYISKSCSAIIQEKFQYAYENTLHKNLDPLLSLVSELVSCVKVLVTQTLQEDYQIETSKHLIKDEGYHYTDQGQRLTDIVANMVTLIANSINGCNSYLRLIGDIPLGTDRKYLDLKQIQITPEKFTQLCSKGMTRNLDKKLISELLNTVGHQPHHNKLARFSTIRAGNEGELGFTYEGTQLLKGVMLDQTPFGRDSTFDPFTIDEKNRSIEPEHNIINNKELLGNEMVFSSDGSLIAASFRALVFKLTDEVDKPDDTFADAILLNFHSFGTEADLIDSLIARFDLTDKSLANDIGNKFGLYSSRSSRLKNRRKLVCKVFQTWMESYWDYNSGQKHLPTLINFFNEGVSFYLPFQGKCLLETAARLSAVNVAFKKTQDTVPMIRDQLSPRTINKLKTSSIYSDVSNSSTDSRLSVFSLDEKVIEEYELTKLPSQNTNSLSLPLPVLNLGTSSLLSKRNLQDMEKLVLSYRSMLNCSIPLTNSSTFSPKEDTLRLIFEWNEMIMSGAKAPQNIIHNDINLADLNPLELAKQLTLIESHLFLGIKPSELLDENFLGKKSSLGLAPNVRSIVNFTNELCDYVLESILYPQMTLKKRIARLKSWLKIALATTYFRNYNSLTSIMIALQNHAITRLTGVWNGLDSKEYELYDYLSKIVHPNNNFKVYRKKLKKYVDESPFGELQSEKSPIPVVPFFNLFLQDLTFIYEGNNTYKSPESFRPNKMVNIDKFLKITKTINMVRYFQVNYNTYEERDENAQSFFNISAQIDVDTQHIKPISLLQEFIFYELWRVNTLYIASKDRAYQLSILSAPRK